MYLEHARQLIETDHAYPCFCTAERMAQLREQQRQRKEQPLYDGLCRRAGLRTKRRGGSRPANRT